MRCASLTAERLREALSYDPSSGRFIRLTQSSNIKAGTPAGSMSGNGYLLIMVDGVRYPAHRLAWLYMTGEWPVGQIDHINLDKCDNTFSNLRDATISQNQANTPTRRNNKCGFKGVARVSGCANKWRATIRFEGQKRHLGCFDTPEDAQAAYWAAAILAFGEFARISPDVESVA